MQKWQVDLSKSAEDFQKLVFPKINQLLGGGRASLVEEVSQSAFAKDLDRLAGIDVWHIKDDSGMRGIASRIQWGDRAFDTFTIRKSRDTGAKTEFAKRKEAIESGQWLYPDLTIQAYISMDRTKLLSCGIAKTRDIIEMIDSGFAGTNRTDNASFYYLDWSVFEVNGFGITIYKEKQQSSIQSKDTSTIDQPSMFDFNDFTKRQSRFDTNP
jgi:hypothetical protein